MSGDNDFLAMHGACMNTNGDIFVSGAAFGYTKKLEVATAYSHGMQLYDKECVLMAIEGN